MVRLRAARLRSSFSSAGRDNEADIVDLSDRRDLYRGYGETLSRAFEFAATPAIFGVVGWFIDRKLGVTPLLTLVFSISVLVYMAWKLLHQYSLRMDAEAERLRTGSRGAP
jgi:hypothetical protein